MINKFETKVVFLFFFHKHRYIIHTHKKGFHDFIYLLLNIYLNVVAKRLQIYLKIFLIWNEVDLI